MSELLSRHCRSVYVVPQHSVNVDVVKVGSTLDGKWKGTGSGNLPALVTGFREFAFHTLPKSIGPRLISSRLIKRLVTPALYEWDTTQVDFSALYEVKSVDEVRNSLGQVCWWSSFQ